MSSKKELLDRARDELFSHINRCGVLQAAEEDQKQWMDETMEYLAERYPQLADADLRELHTLGLRFCRPVIAHGKGSTAKSVEEQPPVEEQPSEDDEVGSEERVARSEDATVA